MRLYVSVAPTIFAEIRRAAKQTKLPVQFYLKQVIECDLAARRPTSPPVVSASTRSLRSGSAPEVKTYQVHLPGNRRLFGV
jgi:hypothetical protein